MHVAKDYIVGVVFEHSYLVTCINTVLVEFKVIYQQAFAHSLSYLSRITMSATARIPRQAVLTVRRRGALCSRPSPRSA